MKKGGAGPAAALMTSKGGGISATRAGVSLRRLRGGWFRGRELEVQPRYHLRRVPGKLRRRAGDIFERERLNENVRKNEGAFRAALDDLSDRPIVGEVRVAGIFWAIEIVRDQASRERPSPQQARHLVQEFFPSRLRELGILMRADNRGDLIQQLCPPLIAGPKEIARINDILRTAITEAIPRLQRTPST